MKEIKDYLEKQAEISKELNEILTAINTIEDTEKDMLYQENERLLAELDSVNNQNIVATGDRITALKERINTLLSKDSTKEDPDFKKNLIKLNFEVTSLSIKLNSLNEDLVLMNKKHENYLNKSNNKTDLAKEAINKLSTQNKEIKHKPNLQKKTLSNDAENKFEFKIGSNVLNILGVVLILIALITFGKYIYTNYMTDILKGISLFVLSSLTLVLGEKVFAKKIPKFAIGISALGVGGLYISLIVNYLVLETISSITAIIITLLITSISLLISSRNNSNIIRIIALFGGYGCLIPMDYLYGIQSYITIVILLIISIANAYIPIKDKNFSIYSSVFNVIFCSIISLSEFLEEPAVIIYLIFTILFNNLMYINSCKKDYNNKQHLSAFITTFFLIMSFSSYTESIFITELTLGMGLTCILISLFSYHLSNNKLKSAFYCHGVYVSIMLLLTYSDKLSFGLDIILAVIIGLTVFLTTASKYSNDKYFKILSVLLVGLGMFKFITTEYIISFIIYIILFSSIVWTLSDKYKNNSLVITLKNSFFGAIICLILINIPSSRFESMFIAVIASIIYVLKLTNIERIRHDDYKNNNKIVLISAFIIINIFGWANLSNTIISLVLSVTILALLTNHKYTEVDFINAHSLLIYSLYFTFGICMLFFNSGIGYNINNLLLSILLMIIAFANVYIGFKFNSFEVRKYGLILSLLVCAKLIIVDFYSYDFIVKAGLFLVIGIVALAISYIYSKLEQELNNKDKQEDIEKM